MPSATSRAFGASLGGWGARTKTAGRGFNRG